MDIKTFNYNSKSPKDVQVVINKLFELLDTTGLGLVMGAHDDMFGTNLSKKKKSKPKYRSINLMMNKAIEKDNFGIISLTLLRFTFKHRDKLSKWLKLREDFINKRREEGTTEERIKRQLVGIYE